MEGVTKCPCCKEVLFRTINISPEDIQGITKEAGTIELSKNDVFIRCDHCHKQVRMVQVDTSPGNPSRFRVAAIQPCT